MNRFVTVCFTTYIITFSSVSLVNAPTNLRVNVKEATYDSKLNNILLDITNNHFDLGQFIHIVVSEKHSKRRFWDDLLKKELFEKWSILIRNSNKQGNSSIAKLPDVYVILFHSSQSLIELFNNLRNHSESWNPAAKFLLFTTLNQTVKTKTAVVKFAINIFNDLWARNILRLSLVMFNESGKTASLVSSSPYSKFYKTCKKIERVSQLQAIDILNNETSLEKIVGYQFDPPNSFFGCSLIGHTFPFPPYSLADKSSIGCRVYSSGVEVQLLKLLGNFYNLSLEIIETPNYGTNNEWLYVYPNGSKNGMLEEIMQSKIDVAFAGIIPPSIFYFCLSLTNTYIEGSMSWYVPGAEIIPVWELVLHSFSGSTWVFMLSVSFLVTMLHYWIRKLEQNESEEPISLTMLALTLGFSIQWTKSSRLRIILLAWSLFCFHVALMFNTRLFSVLTEPPLDEDIETVQNIYDSDLTPCTYGAYKNFYTDRTDGLMRYLIENAHICDNLDESVKVLLKYKNISILAKDDHMAFKFDRKTENIHRLKYNTFISYPVVMPVAKGSAFLGILNKLVFNVTESGLVFKWLSDVHRKWKNKLITREIQELKTENQFMTKKDFVWLYFVFVGGQAIAFLVFLIELYLKPIRYQLMF